MAIARSLPRSGGGGGGGPRGAVVVAVVVAAVGVGVGARRRARTGYRILSRFDVGFAKMCTIASATVTVAVLFVR